MNQTPPPPPPCWQMQKERIVKEDGRYLVYYRFVPLKAEEPRAAADPAPSSSPLSLKEESA